MNEKKLRHFIISSDIVIENVASFYSRHVVITVFTILIKSIREHRLLLTMAIMNTSYVK